jgi:hypothetical protein
MKRILLIAGIILAVLLGLYILSSLFASGSYAHAETYEINSSETEVINAINQVKYRNPELIVPIDLKDGRHDSTDQWYHTYFYYNDKNEIIYCWTRASEQKKTSFAFVSVNAGLELGHWKDVNHDFGFFENKQIKKEFEARILQKVKAELK